MRKTTRKTEIFCVFKVFFILFIFDWFIFDWNRNFYTKFKILIFFFYFITWKPISYTANPLQWTVLISPNRFNSNLGNVHCLSDSVHVSAKQCDYLDITCMAYAVKLIVLFNLCRLSAIWPHYNIQKNQFTHHRHMYMRKRPY